MEKKLKNSRNTLKTAVLTVSAVFWFFSCFTGTLPGTHSAPFLGCFLAASMSGMWHLCSWPLRLQCLAPETSGFFDSFPTSSSQKGPIRKSPVNFFMNPTRAPDLLWARNDYTNNSETTLLCNRCVCNRKINSQAINVCNWRVHRKYLVQSAQLHKKNSCQNAL